MTKVEELLERLLRVDKTPLYCAQGECGFTEGKHIPTRAELEELVVAGAEQMKEAIRKEAVDEHWGSIGEDVRRLCTVPVSVLDPQGTTERRELTWEEYDNLFRGTASGAASVLAPEVKP